MSGIDLRVQVDGVNELLRGFQRISANIAPAMDRLEERVRERLKRYPPEMPGQQYVRTGALGESWNVSADALGTNLYQDRVSLVMTNPVVSTYGIHYAGYVQDEEEQANVHRGRWETAQHALEAETEPFLEDVSRGIEEGFGK